jgi:hypothetical protein
MKKVILTAMAVLSLAACGKETIREVLVTTPPTEAPATTAPASNKYDDYLVTLYDNSAQARSWSDSDLLEFGTIVCGSFDAGATLDTVLNTMSKYSTGKYDDEFYAAVIASAVMHLCPEWYNYVNSVTS